MNTQLTFTDLLFATLFPSGNPHYTLYEGDRQVASLLPSVECRPFEHALNLPDEWEKAYWDINSKGQHAGYVDSRGVEWAF